MSTPLLELIVERIRERGPITVAAYMALALYHPEHGYYTSAARRSGRAGDFFTSVDVGPLFGEILAAQLNEMWTLVSAAGRRRFDLVEAGAGDGRLARDVLDAAARDFPDFYGALQVTLVEASPAAASRQREMLAPHHDRVTVAARRLPPSIAGAIVANELLDALPVHQVVMRDGVLREVHVAESDGALVAVELAPSNGRIRSFLEDLESGPPDGVFVEVGLAAADWVAEAARALDRGFLLLFDYGRDAAALMSEAHAPGTLTAYGRHLANAVDWLTAPGLVDLTSHVNLSAIRRAAVDAGLEPLGVVDQTYFLTALGIAGRLQETSDLPAIRRRLAARTLVMPGGLGSTMKALAFGRQAGTPILRGFSTGRLT